VSERLRVALLLAGDRALQLDVQAAEGYFRQAVELAGDRSTERAQALVRVAWALGSRGEAAEATAIYAEAIPVLLETDEITAGEALRRLSSTAWALGDAERSRASALEAIAVLTPGSVRARPMSATRRGEPVIAAAWSGAAAAA